MEDVQARRDDRGIPIPHAGVRDLRYPITVLDRHQGKQQTVGTVSLSADVAATAKGTHMSRFLEVLNRHVGELTYHTIPSVLAEVCQRLGAERARIDVRFPYFMERAAPVTGARGLMDYDCSFVGELIAGADEFVLGVQVPVTTLCPCSKAISDYGAHNQRCIVSIEVRSSKNDDGTPRIVWIEELIEMAEVSASAPVYPVLKRPDERFVTMLAYDNPVFVEDIVRSTAQRLSADDRVAWFRVDAQTQESIHNHDAFARLEQTN